MKYRADIDGLRAVAVLAVLLYHANVTWFSGGFIGVDVFFVISGYLITKKIWGDLQSNTFSITTFYEKRVRRILPALLTVVLATVLLGLWILPPNSVFSLSSSAIATTLSVANFYLWDQVGYFDQSANLKPLLHTWSLSIEEQFYVVLPLLLVLVSRTRRIKPIIVLSGLCAISFGVNIFTMNADSSGAFYFPHTRAWELLLGGMLTFASDIDNRKLRNLMGITGLLLIGFPIVLFDEATRFPGANAVYPVIGTVLIIFSSKADRPSIVGALLSVRPMVFIGKISYSLYLWHWPLLVFGGIYFITITEFQTGMILVVTFGVSFLSWKYIESPFRSRAVFKRRRVFAPVGAVMVVLLLFEGALYFSQYFPAELQLLKKNVPDSYIWNAEWFDKWEVCGTNENIDSNQPELCMFGTANGVRNGCKSHQNTGLKSPPNIA